MPLTNSANWRWQFRLWWRTGLFGPLVIACVSGALLLRWLPLQVVTPQLRTADETTAPIALLVAGALGIAIQATLGEPSPQVHATAVGHRRWLGPVRVILLLLVFLGTLAVAAPHQLPPGAVIVITTTGEAIACGWLFGHRLAWVLPGVHAAASALMGARTLRGLAWWAWPADPTPIPSAAALPLLILATGLVAETVRPRMSATAHVDE